MSTQDGSILVFRQIRNDYVRSYHIKTQISNLSETVIRFPLFYSLEAQTVLEKMGERGSSIASTLDDIDGIVRIVIEKYELTIYISPVYIGDIEEIDALVLGTLSSVLNQNLDVQPFPKTVFEEMVANTKTMCEERSEYIQPDQE